MNQSNEEKILSFSKTTSGSTDGKRIIWMDDHEDQWIEERKMSCSGQGSSLPVPPGISQPKALLSFITAM